MTNTIDNDPKLSHFDPRPELVVSETLIDQPRFPVVDAHNHLGSAFGGGWSGRDVSELLDVLDAAGVRCVVDLDGGWGEDILDDHLKRFKAVHPDRFICFGGIDWSRWPEEGLSFPELAAARFKAQVGRGAQGLKIWKDLGLTVRDHLGNRVAIDDPRLDEFWNAAAELRVPVTIHTADPVAFFRPHDNHNERYLVLSKHPEWHFGRSGYPSHQQLLGEMTSLIRRHSRTVFIGAHVGCYAENLKWVSDLLDACPNFYVDLGARYDELGRQPYTARAFLIKYSSRVLYGADHPPDVDMYRLTYRFLETKDENFVGPNGDRPGASWRIHGVYLPEEVLRLIYFENASRLFGVGW